MINDFGDDSETKNPFQQAKESAKKQKNKIQNEIHEILDTEELIQRNNQATKRVKLEEGELWKQTRFVSEDGPKARVIKARVHNLTKATKKCSAKRNLKCEKGKIIMRNGQTNLASFWKSSK